MNPRKEEDALHACLGQGNGLLQETACLGHKAGAHQSLKGLLRDSFCSARILLAGLAVVRSWNSLSSTPW